MKVDYCSKGIKKVLELSKLTLYRESIPIRRGVYFVTNITNCRAYEYTVPYLDFSPIPINR